MVASTDNLDHKRTNLVNHLKFYAWSIIWLISRPANNLIHHGCTVPQVLYQKRCKPVNHLRLYAWPIISGVCALLGLCIDAVGLREPVDRWCCAMASRRVTRGVGDDRSAASVASCRISSFHRFFAGSVGAGSAAGSEAKAKPNQSSASV